MSGTFAFEEAAVGIFAAVALADGVVADEELAWWTRVRERFPAFADLTPGLFDPMLARAQRTLSDTPWQDAIAEWAHEVPATHAEAIYALAVELQLVDGQSTRSESRVTAHLARALGLPVERAVQIFELELHRRLGDL